MPIRASTGEAVVDDGLRGPSRKQIPSRVATALDAFCGRPVVATKQKSIRQPKIGRLDSPNKKKERHLEVSAFESGRENSSPSDRWAAGPTTPGRIGMSKSEWRQLRTQRKKAGYLPA